MAIHYVNELETRVSLTLKDFKEQNEYFVREEFLVPILRIAGYESFGMGRVYRDLNLANRTIRDTRAAREHIFPDYVLFEKEIPLWILDAKSPKVKPNRRSHIEQIIAYSLKLGCPNAILSNALHTFVYTIHNGKAEERKYFSIDDICGKNWDEFIELISPEYTMRRCLTFSEALSAYQTDEYVDRSFIMKVLQIYDFNDIKKLLQNKSSSLYKSSHFRDKALPAILVSPYANKDKKLFQDIVSWSMNDKDVIVRENMLTCLISHRQEIHDKSIPSDIYSISPQTFLEELLFILFLFTTKRGMRILTKYRPHNSLLGDFIKFVEANKAVSFPLALPMNKPRFLKFSEYYNYLKLLPSLFDQLVKDERTHDETIMVLESCLSCCAARNKEVFRLLVMNSSVRQKTLIRHLSRKRSYFEQIEHDIRRCGSVNFYRRIGPL